MLAITGEMIISGFVSKVVNDCVDILKEKIKYADKNRKANEQNIETRIYQVTIDALNDYPYNKYKREEKVYDAAECILNGLKNSRIKKKKLLKKDLK